ncbi:hypothetical protein M9Y10_004892 [Tritrichomonas musculus]|uniref:Uncharacterized protein n=1 Tax=Tritrichomonas musculus TaxID=1915356 RepID=A0ABR2JJT5_9EUKA
MESDLSEINNEANTLITQTSNIIKNIHNHDNAAQLAHLSMMIPKLDDVISRYKPFFPDSIQFCNDEQFMNIANQRIKSFLRNRRETILSMYEKTFAHYHHLLDDLTSQIVKTSISIKTIQENSSVEIEKRIEEMKQKFEAQYEEIRESNKKELEKLEKKIDQNVNGIDSRVGEEDQRLQQHYEKLLQSKKESLKMTQSAYEKAKSEVDETTASAQAEINSIVTKNNEILKEHGKSVMSTLVDEEKKVTELQEKVDQITEEYNKVAPELDKKWQDKENELLAKFKEEDEQFELKKEENESLLKSTQKEIDEYNLAISNIQIESDEAIDQAKRENEKKLQNMVINRKSQIEEEVKLRKEKYKGRIHHLKDALKKLGQQLENDENALKERIRDKSNSHQDRVKKIEEEHHQAVMSIMSEIEETKSEISKIKKEWQEEREKIENDSNKQLFELQRKSENSKKYFEIKFERLRKELHLVLQENAKIFDRLSKDNDDLLSLKLKHREEESQLTSRLQEKMKAESEEKIKAKVDELRKKHLTEREKIMAEINSARETETGLDKMYNDALNESKKEPDRLFNSFTSKESIKGMNEEEANDSKWKKEIFLDIKVLKEEEATALTELCQTKDEFKSAVDKALILREKLTKTSKFYTDEVEKAKNQNEDELMELRQNIIEKQKEISELEKQYEENEIELNRKSRLVEKAEDKLNDLRNRLSKDKELIKEKIINNYQPLISSQKEKSNSLAKQISELSNELQLEIEMKKQELLLLEASNAAMIDSIRKESEEIINNFKDQLAPQLKEEEDNYNDELFKEEELKIREINEKSANFQNDENRIDQENKEKLEEQLNLHKKEIDNINNECMKISKKISEKRLKVDQLNNSECKECQILQKSLKKIEKQLIAMQEEERDLVLTDKNHNETYKTFHNNLRKTLPPLRKY